MSIIKNDRDIYLKPHVDYLVHGFCYKKVIFANSWLVTDLNTWNPTACREIPDPNPPGHTGPRGVKDSIHTQASWHSSRRHWHEGFMPSVCKCSAHAWDLECLCWNPPENPRMNMVGWAWPFLHERVLNITGTWAKERLGTRPWAPMSNLIRAEGQTMRSEQRRQ